MIIVGSFYIFIDGTKNDPFVEICLDEAVNELFRITSWNGIVDKEYIPETNGGGVPVEWWLK